MPDFVAALEVVCKSARTVYTAVGAVVCGLVPPNNSATVAVSAESPEVVSVTKPAPTSGQPTKVCPTCDWADNPNCSSSFHLGTEPMTWMEWALPAIWDVLAEHSPHELPVRGYIRCNNSLGNACSEWFHMQDWREHVGPLIADRIGCDPARAAMALAHYTPKK